MDKSIFREYDIRGIYPKELDEQAAFAIAYAFAKKCKAQNVALVRDKRVTSAAIHNAVISGLAKAKCKIHDLGIDSTPSWHFVVGDKKFDGGIIITASHNPLEYTGMKLCTGRGISLGTTTGLNEIAKEAEKHLADSMKGIKPRIVETNILSDYYNFIFSVVDKEKIKKLKVVLDASSGSAAKTAEYMFIRIPGQTIKMNFKKDKYHDHGLNPLLLENRKYIQAEVVKQKADLGVIWDGDGDRVIFIDEKGKFIEPYYLNCLLSQIVLGKIKSLGLRSRKIGIDARSRLGIVGAIKEAGGVPVLIRAGYSNIVKRMNEERILFGCETSGHFFFNLLMDKKYKTNYIVSDGLISPLLIMEHLSQSGMKISELINKFQKQYKISGELNFKIKNFDSLVKKIIKEFKGYKTDEIDGLSVIADDWSFNIRPSKNEPLVRLNIEARKASEMRKLKDKIIKLF